MNRITPIYILFGCLHFVSVFWLSSWVSQSPQFAFLHRNWGFNFLIYYPIPVVVLAYGVYTASLIPAIQIRIATALNNLHRRIADHKRTHVFLAVAIIATLVMWVVRQKYPFLGDGHVRLTELDQGIIHTSGAPFIKMLMSLSSTFGWGGRQTYQLASTLLTLPFVFLGLCVAHEIGSNTITRAASSILIVFSGLIQIYAGYIEIYAPLPVLILLTVWLGLLSERIPILRYCSLLIAAIAFLVHPLCGILLPPALYLVWFHDLRRYKFVYQLLLAAVIASGAALALSQGVLDRIIESTLPILPEANRTYAILTATNFWERLNGIILCSPAAIPLILLLTANRRETTSSSRAGFLWLLTGCGIISVFAFDFVLGSQDWDVIALVTFPVCLILAHYLSSANPERLPAIALPAITICVLNTVPWVLVNHTDASIVRLEDTLIDDPGTYFRTHNRSIRIALSLKAEDKRASGIEVLKRESARIPKDTQVLHNLAALQHQSARYDDAIITAQTLLNLVPWNTYAYRILVQSLRHQGQEEEAEKLSNDYAENLIKWAETESVRGNLRDAASAWGASTFTDLNDPSILARSSNALEVLTDAYLNNPGKAIPVPLYKLPNQMRNLARHAYGLGKREEAVLLWQTALRMGDRVAILYLNLGAVQHEIGEKKEAEKTWNQGLQMHANDVDLKYNIATLLGERGDIQRSELLFNQAISTAPDSAKLFVRYGNLLESRGQAGRALEVYKTGLSRSPDDPDLRKAHNVLSNAINRNER